MAKQFTLGRSERLKSRKSIELLFTEGKKFVVTPYKILYRFIVSGNDPVLLFGTGVSSKMFKKAVDRNRVKRLTKEAYRLQKRSLQERIKAGKSQLHVFFIYTAKNLPEYSEVLKKIAIALDRLEKLTQT